MATLIFQVLGDLTGPIFLVNMVYQHFYKKRKDAEAAQKHQDALDTKDDAQQFLDNAIETLTKQGIQQKIHRVELFRILEELLPLLCLNACHQRVTNEIQTAVRNVIRQQRHAQNNYGWQIGKFQIGDTYNERRAPAIRDWAHRFNRIARAAGESHAVEHLRLLLLWHPEVSKVFEETTSHLWHPNLTEDTDVLAGYPISPHVNSGYALSPGYPYSSHINIEPILNLEAIQSSLGGAIKMPDNILAGRVGIKRFHESLRQSVEYFFNHVKEIHETQKQLVTALRKRRVVNQSYDDEESRASRAAYLDEATVLRRKLSIAVWAARHTMSDFVKSSVGEEGEFPLYSTRPDPSSPIIFGIHVRVPTGWIFIFRNRWDEAMLHLGLLAGRIEAIPAVECRQEKIAELFKAIGATDAQNKDIQQWIRSYYEATYELWLEDDWIQTVMKPRSYTSQWDNPFALGQDDTDSDWFDKKQHQLLLNHNRSFQLQSPMQLTKQTALTLMKTQEDAVLKIFTENLQNMQEIDDINSRAQNHTLTGNFDAALADYEKAKDLWPDNAAVLCALGHYYSRLGRFNEAITEFQTAAALVAKGSAPEDAPSLLNLAIIYAKQKENLEEAVKLTRRALALFEEFPMTATLHNLECTRQILGWLYHQLGEVDKAIEELEAAETAIVKNPKAALGTPHFYLVLGDAYKAAERYPEARKYWKRGWQLANRPEWTTKMQGTTPFEADEDKAHRTELGERLGIQENAS